MTKLLLRAPTFVLVAVFAVSLASAVVYKTVSTSTGQLRGFRETGCFNYRGVPYAEPPVGQLRFEPPRDISSWSGVLDALQFGHACMQSPGPLYTGGGYVNFTISEDCLTLNVVTPRDDSPYPRPVLVHFHGGNFQTGSSSSVSTCDLSKKIDAVIVTVNYRLNLFGFSHMNDSTANLGLRDQVSALRWIESNIAAFGGDPDNVTLIGHSAGGTSVLVHPLNEEAWGLFDRSWALSASWSMKTKQHEVSHTLALMEGVNCTDVACMKSLPAQVLYEKYAELALDLTAYVDGSVVPFNPITTISNGDFYKVPVVLGHQTHEGRSLLYELLHAAGLSPADLNLELADLVLSGYFEEPLLSAVKEAYYPYEEDGNYFEALALIAYDFWYECSADALSAAFSLGAASYRYYFTHDPEFPNTNITFNFGATHDTILAFVYGPKMAHIAFIDHFSDEDYEIWNAFASSLRLFMRENTPGGKGSRIRWPPYTRPVSSSERQRAVIDTNGPFAFGPQTSFNQRLFCFLWSFNMV